MPLAARKAPYVTIRPAGRGDVEAIAAVHLRAYCEAYEGIMPRQHLENMTLMGRIRTWRQILLESRPPTHTLVAATPGSPDGIVGFVNGGPARDHTPERRGPRDRGERPGGEIYALYLLAAHHNLGIGRALFSASANYMAMHGHDSLHLWVLADNPTTGFYERMGGRRGETVMTMRAGKSLGEAIYRWRLPLTPP